MNTDEHGSGNAMASNQDRGCGACFHRMGAKVKARTLCLRLPGNVLRAKADPACERFLAIEEGERIYRPPAAGKPLPVGLDEDEAE
jgi:hypothetical protein